MNLYNENTELQVLSKVMGDYTMYRPYLQTVKSEYFYEPINGIIWLAIERLIAAKKPIDHENVVEELKRMGSLEKVGGAGTIHLEYKSNLCSEEHFEGLVTELSNYYSLRTQRDAAERMIQKIDNAVPSEALSINSEAIESLQETISLGKAKTYYDGDGLADELFQFMEDAEEGVMGVQTFSKAINYKIGGWLGGEFIVIGARPGMGKTAWVLRDVYEAILAGLAIGFFSIEMTAKELAKRLVCIHIGISSHKMKRYKDLSDNQKLQMKMFADKLRNYPIYVEDLGTQTNATIRRTAFAWKRKYNIDRIYVDYLQIMDTDNKKAKGDDFKIATEASKGFKALAKSLDIPVIALAQLSREVEKRGGDKRPKLSDLRSSGQIEQDADCIAFLYRDEYYKIYEDENHNPTDGIAEFIIAKFRTGALDTVKLFWHGPTMRYDDLDKRPEGYQSPRNKQAQEKEEEARRKAETDWADFVQGDADSEISF